MGSGRGAQKGTDLGVQRQGQGKREPRPVQFVGWMRCLVWDKLLRWRWCVGGRVEIGAEGDGCGGSARVGRSLGAPLHPRSAL